MLRDILVSAVVAGLAAGLVLTAVQRFQVVPIILAAETYEGAGEGHAHGAAHGHEPGDGHASAHDEAWAPDDGLERTVWTAVANVGLGVGFALLLCAAYAWRGGVGLREGVLWGVAGLAIFFVNPAFGLHPEIPGADAAAVEARQAWWIFAVACTALGLALLAFRAEVTAALAGTGLCLVPHVIGAPHAEVAAGSAPLELARAFVGASYVANAIFWVVLGAVSAWSFRRFVRPAD